VFHSHPPAPNAGDMSSRTAALRPALELDAEQIECARRLRRQGMKVSTIAEYMETTKEVVDRALLAMRTPKEDRSRGTLNVTLAAREFVMANRKAGEPVHVTVDRLLGELEQHRGGAL
jgi:transcriptional regulator